MNSRITVKEKLGDRYKLFLQYCADTGKFFIDELKPEDFIAYRTEYSVARCEVEQLKNFLYSESEKPARENDFNEENALLNLMNAAANNEPFIKIFIDALKNFSEGVKQKYSFCNEIDEKISALPQNIQTKKLLPFAQAYNLAENIPAELSVADFPKFLEISFAPYKAEVIKNFVEWLNFDLNSIIKKIFDKIFSDERKLKILLARNDGKTLQEIGIELNMTRERVRQIEARIINKFFIFYSHSAHDIFYFMRALNDGQNILNFAAAEKILGTKYAKILWSFLPKINFDKKNYHFDKTFDALIFGKKTIVKTFDAAEFVNSLPDLMTEDIFLETVKNFAQENNLSEETVLLMLLKVYQRSGKFFHKSRITLAFKISYILKEKFPHGYKIANAADFSKFLHYLQEIFDDTEKRTSRNIDTRITYIGVLCGRGKYIHRDFINVPPQILELINNFIAGSQRNVLTYKEIFTALKSELIDTQITNSYFLQGVLKFYGCPYILRKDYLTKNAEMNFTEEFNNFVKDAGEVSVSEIKAHFISFKDENISMLVTRCPEIIRIGDGNFLHESRLNLQEKDFVDIEKFLRQVCQNLPVSSRSLLNWFSEKFFDFISRNEIYNHDKLFGILRYMFRNEFYFSRPYVSTQELKDFSNKKFLLMLLQDSNKIDIEDVLKICEEQEINYVSSSILIDNLRPEFIKVDEFSVMRSEILGINDEIISAVCEKIKAAISLNGGWQSAKTFSDYEWLPQLEISWNSFLLESVAALAAEKIPVIKSSSTESNFSTAIFVSEDFAEENFNSFVLRILIEEHDKQPFQSEAEILEWLQDNGICNKKLPKFLKTENHIKFFNGELFIE